MTKASRDFLLVQSITLARIPLGVAIAAILAAFEPGRRVALACAALLLAMELTDLLDGFLARRLGVVSEWGALLDPYADSVSRVVVFWALARANLAMAAVPLVMACRDVTVANCRVVWTRLGASCSARWSGKAKAVTQGVGAFVLILRPFLETRAGAEAARAASWCILVATVGSGLDYALRTVALVRGRRD
jgi:CDP-diacylglycerol--glycerol-3-phosphate 3-phosphatidyltransferase